jgi:hypothetical protein
VPTDRRGFLTALVAAPLAVAVGVKLPVAPIADGLYPGFFGPKLAYDPDLWPMGDSDVWYDPYDFSEPILLDVEPCNGEWLATIESSGVLKELMNAGLT